MTTPNHKPKAAIGLDAYYSAAADARNGHAACTVPGKAGWQRVTELVAPGSAPSHALQ